MRIFLVVLVAACIGFALFLVSRDFGPGVFSKGNTGSPFAFVGGIADSVQSFFSGDDGKGAGKVSLGEQVASTTRAAVGTAIQRAASDTAAPVTKKVGELQSQAREEAFKQTDQTEGTLGKISATIADGFTSMTDAARQALFGSPATGDPVAAVQGDTKVCPDGTIIYRSNSSCSFIVCPPSR